jgi:hypothetical protein
MAAKMRPESFLPTIKCSTCAQEIEMMALAEHICIPRPSQSLISGNAVYIANNNVESPEITHQATSSKSANLGLDPAIKSEYFVSRDPAIQAGLNVLNSNAASKSPGFLRSGRNVPPRIDALAASKSTAQFNKFMY